MKREDIKYINSWAKSFRNCSPVKVMQAIIEGIWIASNNDPEDIYKVYPELIIRSFDEGAQIDKEFGICPFEFAIEDGETYRKSRDINSFGVSWHLDKYEMRKAITRNGLEAAKQYKITRDEIIALHNKYGWDDDAMYKELINTRQDLWSSLSDGSKKFCDLNELAFKDIRAAFCPHFDTRYNWMDYPEKAGFSEIPNIENRPHDWEAR